MGGRSRLCVVCIYTVDTKKNNPLNGPDCPYPFNICSVSVFVFVKFRLIPFNGPVRSIPFLSNYRSVLCTAVCALVFYTCKFHAAHVSLRELESSREAVEIDRPRFRFRFSKPLRLACTAFRFRFSKPLRLVCTAFRFRFSKPLRLACTAFTLLYRYVLMWVHKA